MSTHEFDIEDILGGLRPTGCVQPFIEGFIATLSDGNYSFLSVREYIRSAGHFGRWMDHRSMRVTGLTASVVEDFARHRCRCPGVHRHGHRPSRRTVARVKLFVEHLRNVGVIVGDTPSDKKPVVPPPLVGFRYWMVVHHGVKEKTVELYQHCISLLLPTLGDDPQRYNAALVRSAVLDGIRGRTTSFSKNIITATRAFLKFHGAQGRCPPYLVQAVPTIPQWSLASLPRYLEADDVERVIASCDLAKPHGIRDRAVLLLLARLGLRAGDVVAMKLDDLNWDKGTVTVLGKGRRDVCLPMPQDAGDALLGYLVDARPKAHSDRVFLCAQAPIRPFGSSSTVSAIVRLALQRAGISDPPSRGAHLLRHSAATAMLRAGVGLDAIATVLRHRSSDTTAYYAKIDLNLLQRVAQPWPEGAPC